LRVIDIHTHAFPDGLAARAIAALQAETPGVRARLDGRLSSLAASMGRAGVDVCVVASIATRPLQFASILAWSREIASPRIVPFASVHPDDAEAVAHVRAVAGAGLKGIKLHPYYQGFAVDEDRVQPLYAEMERLGLVLLMHAGFDPAFERRRVADAPRIAAVARRFPRLKLVAAHLGGWQDWELAERELLGSPVCLDVSDCLDTMPRGQAVRFLEGHPPDCLLFGSDSPWVDQAEALRDPLLARLPADRREALLGGNAARLLGLC
jgi:predicted TIM-barrel fold metal-dependent hydrolase